MVCKFSNSKHLYLSEYSSGSNYFNYTSLEDQWQIWKIMECYANILNLRLYFKVRNDVNVYRLLQRWLKKAWIRNLALPGMQWWVKDMVLNSHMKSRIFSTCILEGLSQFVCGNAPEITIIHMKILSVVDGTRLR